MTTEVDGVTAVDTITSNSADTLFNFGSFGQLESFADCALAPLSPLTLEVVANDTLNVSVDPNNSENWDFTVITQDSNGGGEGECRLVITDLEID